MNSTKNLLFATATLLLLSFTLAQKKTTTIYIIGDSTAANKEAKAYPETGWGMEFQSFFQTDVKIDNRALNGRSTKSFRAENRWQPIVDKLTPNDYVFIEFGHNDEKIDKPAVGTTIAEFKANLVQYIKEARAKKASPVLLTPIARRSFKNGVLMDTHGDYPRAVKQVADSLNVPIIDMLAKTESLLIRLGDEKSIALFNHVEPGNENYPEGKKDDTHLSPLGAKQVASLVASGIKELKLNLAKKLK
ncbi:rhamnogalacturonan acetylesterase [Pedobacter sp. AW1-32]|uniref:rhamnogalacturonan acetylesterase n=1 Tax=Pedobacter sp. AW1-32 TaxID=3383026 RepID=UPI003FF0D0AD